MMLSLDQDLSSALWMGSHTRAPLSIPDAECGWFPVPARLPACL